VPEAAGRDAILEAAIAEFASKGYHEANTNAIRERAGVSKGLVFHHYGSKPALYMAALERAEAMLGERMSSYGYPGGGNLFETIADATAAKLRASIELPEAYRLVFGAYVDAPAELAAELRARLASAIAASRETLGRALDATGLAPGTDRGRALDLVCACVRGLADDYVERYRAMSPAEALERIGEARDELAGMVALLGSGILARDGGAARPSP